MFPWVKYIFALALWAFAAGPLKAESGMRVIPGIETFSAVGAADVLTKDLKAAGQTLVDNIGYDSSAGTLITKAPLGAKLTLLFPVEEDLYLGASAGHTFGPNSAGTITAESTLVGQGKYTYNRRASFTRVLAEIYKRVPMSDSSCVFMGGGAGLAIGTVRDVLIPSGSVVQLGAERQSAGKTWTGYAWEAYIGIGYGIFSFGAKIVGFPAFKGNDDLSELKWGAFGVFAAVNL